MIPEILFCDNHLVVTIKPAGIPTQATTLEKGWQEICQEWAIKKFNKPGKVFLEPIHRLDKSVEGIVVFAKTSKALSRLQQMMRERKFIKIYQAFIEGVLPSKEGEFEDFIIHEDHHAEIGSLDSKNAKKATLTYQVTAERQGISEVAVTLVTGRYHQIRAQFSSRGFPIVGDKKYGSKINYIPFKIALCHLKISFAHPVTHEPLCFSAKPLNVFL